MTFLVEFELDNGMLCYSKYNCSSMQQCDELAEIDTLNMEILKGCKKYNIFVDVENAHDMM